MVRPSWSRLRSVAQPALGTELRLIIELLGVIARDGTPQGAVLPSRVRVGSGGQVQVGPLGSAEHEEERRFIAPEARPNEGEGGGVACAVYAVGVLLFEAVAGVPFESAELVEKELVAARVAAQAAGLGASHWELELLEMAAQATLVDPAARWPSAEAFSAALLRAAAGHVASRDQLAAYVKFTAASASFKSASFGPESARFKPEEPTTTPLLRSAASPPEAGDPDPPAVALASALETKQTLQGIGIPTPLPPPPEKHQTLIGVGNPTSQAERSRADREPSSAGRRDTLRDFDVPLSEEQRSLRGEVEPTTKHRETLRGFEASLEGASPSSTAGDSAPPAAAGSVPAQRSRRGFQAGALVATAVVVVLGVAVPVAYYEGYFGWSGAGASGELPSSGSSPEVSVEAAQPEAPGVAAAAAGPSSSAASPSPVELAGGAPGRGATADRDAGANVTTDTASSSSTTSAPEAAPPDLPNRALPQPRRPRPVSPPVRDYGI